VGLVAGAGFADFGNDVVCVDIDHPRIARLQAGEIPIHEPGLAELVHANVAGGRLRFATEFADATRDADVVLLCVGTPSMADGSADLSQVLMAAQAVGAALHSDFTVIVNKSTVPVGTAERVREVIAAASTRPFAVVSNPEFLKEGSAVEDFLRPMRVLVGVGPGSGPSASGAPEAVDERARTVMRRLYAAVVRTSDRMLLTDARSAELTKYACNAYLAMRVSFINDVAGLCERVGADVELVRRGMGMDTRIGPRFLFPGIGYGGSCFPKDTRALLECAHRHGMELPLVAATEQINERQKVRLLHKLLSHFGDGAAGGEGDQALDGKTVAVWGLSFKPETDDCREAPALRLIEELVARGARVRASDPVANQRAAELLSRSLGSAAALVSFHEDAYLAAAGADALCLCTEWRQFRQPNFRRLVRELRGPVVFDGRNIWDPAQVRELGLQYYGIGRA
jgi:UDPglucose 6-dehydrogenase